MTKRATKQGIYRILHTDSGKSYVGQSVDIATRWASHRSGLVAGTHKNEHLQSAWLKYGCESFRFEVLELVTDRDALSSREAHYCDLHRVYQSDFGYNSAVVDPAGTHRMSDVTKEKIRRSHLGLGHTAATREKLSAIKKAEIQALVDAGTPHHNKGIVRSAETRAKMSAAKRGVPASAETKAKLSASKKGKPLPPGVLEASIRANTGRRLSEDHCQKMSAARKGKPGTPHTEEFKQRVSDRHRGKVVSEETRAKLSASKKAWYVARLAAQGQE